MVEIIKSISAFLLIKDYTILIEICKEKVYAIKKYEYLTREKGDKKSLYSWNNSNNNLKTDINIVNRIITWGTNIITNFAPIIFTFIA